MSQTASRILVVDDDARIALGVRTALEASGYEVAVALDGLEAMAATGRFDPHAIVLDIAMPGLDGLGVCRALRAAGDRTPVLLLTARKHASDAVEGLDAGADDYVAKPFDVEELLARVRAMLRRSTPTQTDVRWRDLVLYTEERMLVGPVARIQLTRIETILLEVLFANQERVTERARLEDAVWGEDQPQSNALEVYLSQLRRKLAVSGHDAVLRNVRGFGYRLYTS